MDACKERSSSRHCSYRDCCALDIDKNALKKTIYRSRESDKPPYTAHHDSHDIAITTTVKDEKTLAREINVASARHTAAEAHVYGDDKQRGDRCGWDGELRTCCLRCRYLSVACGDGNEAPTTTPTLR